MEKWLPVPGYEGMYSVSSEGKVASLARTVMRPHGRTGNMTEFKWPAKMLKLSIRGGAQSVALCNEGRVKPTFVAQIVLLAFVGPPPTPKHAAHHRDGNKLNNRVENLMWATPQERGLGLMEAGAYATGPDHHRYKHGRRARSKRKPV